MKLAFDPADGQAFWEAVEKLPGYPQGVHQPIPQLIFESGAIHRTPDVLKQAGADPASPLLVVMDQTPMKRGPDDLKKLVLDILRRTGWEVEALVMAPDETGQVHTEMQHIDRVKASLRPGAAVLAVGSGVVCDITKHACYLYHKNGGSRVPLVMMQTANSVNAFTSNMAPVFVDGVKRTLDSTYIDALICDLETLRDAPREMTVAGVGDLLAAFVSLPDWYLAHRLGMDAGYNQLPEQLMGPLEDIFVAEAGAIHAGTPEGMGVLARLMSLGGLAMSLTHATTPMSGYEHVISHILDRMAESAHMPQAQHGTQVSLAAIIGTALYRRFLDGFDPATVDIDACYPSVVEMRARVLASFEPIDPSGKMGEECWSDYQLKLGTWHAHRDDFVEFLRHWDEIKARLQKFTAPPERLAEILRAVGAPVHFDELVPPASEQQVRFAFMNAPFMRKRLTIGDMLIFLNWNRESLWDELWAETQGV